MPKFLRKATQGIRGLVSKKKHRYQKDGFDLDLTYITSRIIAMGFPAEGVEAAYRNDMMHVQTFFSRKHPRHYKIYNLCSERAYPSDRFDPGACARYPFDDHNPCPFRMVLDFCNDAAAFLAADERNVIAVHCKAGKGRTGLMISALLCRLGHDSTVGYEGEAAAWRALAFYGMMRTSNSKGVTIPSQQRWVVHYAEYLQRYVRPGLMLPTVDRKIRLRAFTLEPRADFDTGGGCDPYVVIRKMGSKSVELYNSWTDKRAKSTHKHWDGGVPYVCSVNYEISGEVQLTFMDWDQFGSDDKMFSVWIQTSMITEPVLVLTKDSLDGAVKDKSCKHFPKDFVCTLEFDIQDAAWDAWHSNKGASREALSAAAFAISNAASPSAAPMTISSPTIRDAPAAGTTRLTSVFSPVTAGGAGSQSPASSNVPGGAYNCNTIRGRVRTNAPAFEAGWRDDDGYEDDVDDDDDDGYSAGTVSSTNSASFVDGGAHDGDVPPPPPPPDSDDEDAPPEPPSVLSERDESDGEEQGGKARMTMANIARRLVSKKKLRYQKDGFDLDLTYITPSIIAMGFPSDGIEAAYRNRMKYVQDFMSKYHAGHYKVYNLCSERSYTADHFERCAQYPFDDHNPCPLSMLYQFCRDAATFMAEDPRNVVAVHCKAGKGRTGLMVSALLLFTQAFNTAAEALQYYGYKRTSNRKGVTIPSQQRFVHYFDQFLRHYYHANLVSAFPFSGAPVAVTGIAVEPPARFDRQEGCTPYFIVTNMQGAVLYDHRKSGGKLVRWAAPEMRRELTCSFQAPGEFKVTFYNNATLRDEKMFHFWLHSAFLAGSRTRQLEITKSELDGALKDKACEHFPDDFKCTLYFRPVAQQ